MAVRFSCRCLDRLSADSHSYTGKAGSDVRTRDTGVGSRRTTLLANLMSAVEDRRADIGTDDAVGIVVVSFVVVSNSVCFVLDIGNGNDDARGSESGYRGYSR